MYSYGADRKVAALELLLGMGWGNPPTASEKMPLPNVNNLKETDLMDLVGEAQALPCLAVATLALLGAARDAGSAILDPEGRVERQPEHWTASGLERQF